MPRNRPWSKEELILALDLYFKIGPKGILSPDKWNLTARATMGDKYYRGVGGGHGS